MTAGTLAADAEREIWDYVRVLKFFRNQLDDRQGDSAFVGSGNDAQTLNFEYQRLEFLVDLYIDAIQEIWRGLRRWADEYNGIPDTRFDDQIPDANPARLVKMFATTGMGLTQTQYQSGFTNESFSSTGTIWEKFYNFNDNFLRHIILMRGRAASWRDEADALGTGDRAQEAVTLFEELTGAAAYGRNVVADSSIRIKDYQNPTPGVRTNRLRREYIVRPNVDGLYLLNTDSPPAGPPTPVQAEPDIDTVGTFSQLANGPA